MTGFVVAWDNAQTLVRYRLKQFHTGAQLVHWRGS
jgi:hypothetical protein